MAAEKTEPKVSEILDNVERQAYAPDSAIAVKVSDLQALVEHARKSGAEELAARFEMFK